MKVVYDFGAFMNKSSLFWLATLIMSFTQQAYAGDCRRLSYACVDGPGTKYIQGFPIYRACWDYQSTFECVEPGSVDYCTPLVSAGCSKTSSVCVNRAFNDTCVSYEDTYRCGDTISTPPNTVKLASTYTLTQDTTDRTACESIENNASLEF